MVDKGRWKMNRPTYHHQLFYDVQKNVNKTWTNVLVSEVLNFKTNWCNQFVVATAAEVFYNTFWGGGVFKGPYLSICWVLGIFYSLQLGPKYLKHLHDIP